MAEILIPNNGDFASISKLFVEAQQADADALAKAVDITFDEDSFLKVDGMAYLTAKCLNLAQAGTKISVGGDTNKVSYLNRMDFHTHLNLDQANLPRRPEHGRFLPIMLINSFKDVHGASSSICDLVVRQFDDAPRFIPAMEWAVNELIDNIVNHAESPVPGVVCAQFYKKINRLEVAICDMGRGIRESLATGHQINSHQHALEEALKRGVTRDQEVGQGNGLAGSLEICKANEADFLLWSGDARYTVKNGGDGVTSEIPGVKGTGLFLGMKTNRPVKLTDTFIAKASTIFDFIESTAQRLDEDKSGIDVAAECANTGTRPPGRYLRRKIVAILPEMEEALVLNFENVRSASSSFLDELLGRLADEFGSDVFKQKIQLAGMEETIRKMANVVIAQRTGELNLEEQNQTDNQGQAGEEPQATESANGWLIRTEADSANDLFSVELPYTSSLFSGIREGDGLAIQGADGEVIGFARLFRKRSAIEETLLYFDGITPLKTPTKPEDIGLAIGTGDEVALRQDWTAFEAALKTAAGINFDDLPRLKGDREPEQAYLRELLKLATVDDLLGPARGPEEEIVGMSVRDRYLVGKLAPRERGPEENIEGLAGASASPEESDEAPDDLVPLEEIGEGQKGKKASRRSLPGEEFNSAGGAKDIDSDDSEQVDASKNQSFVPSSVGLTACVAGDVEELELELNWGRYERTESAEQLKDNGNPKRAWKRRPSGGKIKLRLDEGPIKPVAPDAASPEVLVQGRIRPPLPTGDRLVTVFLVNNQVQPEQNQDEAWVFQPEIILRDAEGKSIFRRRPVYEPEGDDPERAERDALEMVYRRRVEFAVGHTISIQVKVADENVEQATEIRSSIMPEHEVEVTETPGLNLEDRPEMRRLIDEGHLDMKRLAEMEPEELVAALSIITNDYQAWIAEQRARIGHDVVGHDDAAKAAMDRCEEVLERLREGITTLKDNDKALEAFRFANLAMAHQRIRSIYSLKRRRGEEINVEDLDEPKNRSWRPFQLAFILLSIPAMADPTHRDRTRPVDAYADLLWFPTGGGKTEAYLGVAAFTMAIRRRQGDLGGLDSSRGLSVIMRYTLRLLTLQQFQRASTLICAMEVLRRQDEETWGKEPFSIGLWVGMRVTPNTTEQSHDHITARRARRLPKDSSPCQLTSCPWCGSEIRPERDIKVSRYKSGEGKTVLYCGDSHSVCDFSEANSPEWGIPARVVDEEIYRRPPSMMIATVDKFALMAWKGAVRNLFGKANRECSRHGLSWPGDLDCNTAHNAAGGLPRATVEDITPIRPPDLIIQDEFHLISGPLGTMVGLYETVVDKLATWEIDGNAIRPKIIASTATARKAEEQINNVFMRKVSIFPPHGLDIEDNFFSAQRDIKQKAGRKYLGICSPGSARPAVLIRLYAALLTASQNLFEHFGKGADPWMTTVGYFNSLRELGGMKRLAEDDVQTRCYRVQMSDVARPGLAQRSARNVDELTSRVSSEDIPKILDALEIPFRADFDTAKGIYQSLWESEEARSMDVVLATNMLSVGVDINRLGLMAVNGQPKSTSEYIQATSRVGRSFPGLVCTVLTWSRPRDLSHYESFNHYHSTFYMHVEAQSVTPFTPRALDRGMMGVMVSQLRLNRENYTPNRGAGEMKNSGSPEAAEVVDILSERAWKVTDETEVKILSENMALERCDKWANEANRGGRDLGYEARPNSGLVPLLKKPGAHAWDKFTVPFSMREVEPGVRLVMEDGPIGEGPGWQHPPLPTNNEGGET